jgi:putative transposase
VGWSVADHMREELVIDAFRMAVANRRPGTGEVVFHSDYAEVDVKPENLRMAC